MIDIEKVTRLGTKKLKLQVDILFIFNHKQKKIKTISIILPREMHLKFSSGHYHAKNYRIRKTQNFLSMRI